MAGPITTCQESWSPECSSLHTRISSERKIVSAPWPHCLQITALDTKIGPSGLGRVANGFLGTTQVAVPFSLPGLATSGLTLPHYHTHTHTSITHACVHTHMHMRVHMRTHTSTTHAHTCMHAHTCTHAHVCVRAYTHTSITRACTCIHTCTHHLTSAASALGPELPG